jgi:hypothetical protein
VHQNVELQEQQEKNNGLSEDFRKSANRRHRLMIQRTVTAPQYTNHFQNYLTQANCINPLSRLVSEGQSGSGEAGYTTGGNGLEKKEKETRVKRVKVRELLGWREGGSVSRMIR